MLLILAQAEKRCPPRRAVARGRNLFSNGPRVVLGSDWNLKRVRGAETRAQQASYGSRRTDIRPWKLLHEGSASPAESRCHPGHELCPVRARVVGQNPLALGVYEVLPGGYFWMSLQVVMALGF